MNTGTVYQRNLTTPRIVYRWGNPFQYKQAADAEMMLKQGSRGSSGRGPHRPSRETRVIIATLVGIVICCIIGVVIGASVAGIGGIFVGLVGGMIVGGLGGSYVGELLKRRHLKKLDQKANPGKTDKDSQGPFIK